MTANREGFHLADVNNAPLAQRRRRKQRVPSDDSGYVSSGTITCPTPVPGENRVRGGGVGTSTTGAVIDKQPTSVVSASSAAMVTSEPSTSGRKRKRELFPLTEERSSQVSKADSVSKMPKEADGNDSTNVDMDQQKLKPSFQIYRDSPESKNRDTIDFCKNPFDVKQSTESPPSDLN